MDKICAQTKTKQRVTTVVLELLINKFLLRVQVFQYELFRNSRSVITTGAFM